MDGCAAGIQPLGGRVDPLPYLIATVASFIRRT
jgi:hypothetical protein